MRAKKNVIAIVGATGTGKSVLADALAVHLGSEIISADSIQVYRGMNIGTAKTPLKKRSVKYHCVDVVDPNVEYSAALYQREARAVIEALLAKDLSPIICGGTGLYVRAALDEFAFDEQREGISAGASMQSASLRESLNAQAKVLGADEFHALLAKRDPDSAALIHPNNVRRVVRAFELLDAGSSYAKQSRGFDQFVSIYPTVFLGLKVERQVLYELLDRRVDTMIKDCLLDEVKALVSAGYKDSLAVSQAIGYKEFFAVLDGKCEQLEAVNLVKQATRRYAKRQETWFKRDRRIRWIDVSELHKDHLANKINGLEFTQQLLKMALLELA